ncbi:ras-related protein Rab-34-like [Hippocampus comes]|uniref:ras-related protein Rab-34-like n=1 Tax=Hippocampus comes TaxID=109280 RepID=UPI00094F0C7A|nr:PREDICTED: ras-related protein Rab-34-like [Hippocampus comes]
MLPPDKNDRIITRPPKCCSPKAALQTKEVFHSRVKAARQTLKEDAVGRSGAARCRWDTAGQERFKCIASTGAQAIIAVFDLSRESSLARARQWLEDAMKDDDPSGVLLFLVGTKKDLSSPERLARVQREAARTSEEIRAEYWAVSAESGAAYFSPEPSTRRTNKGHCLSAAGDGVRDLFLRVAALSFEADVLRRPEKSAAGNAADVVGESRRYARPTTKRAKRAAYPRK